LPGLLFDKREVQRFRIVQEILLREEVQLGDVARILDCRNVKALIGAGHLEVSSTRGSQTFVTKDSIESFSASFVAARPVLEEAGVAIAKLLKVARFAGIQLLSVQDTHRVGRIWFIPRAEKDALLSAVPRFKDCSPPRANCPSQRKRAVLIQENAVDSCS
ncbi:MAG TPA: hypothetical protein VGU23_03575, partial [Acidobacteriaceae bacterium]|nr:hypothetical protein [Acidobacteriaceae bacterium]